MKFEVIFLAVVIVVTIASVAALFSPFWPVKILGGIVLGIFLFVGYLLFWPLIKMSPRLLSAFFFINGFFWLDALLCKVMLSFWQSWNAVFTKLGFSPEHEELSGWYNQIASNSVMKGDFEKACSMNRKCLDIQMNDGTISDVGEARVNLGYVLLKNGEIEESSQLFKKGLKDVENEFKRLQREVEDVNDEYERGKDSEEAYSLEADLSVVKLDFEQIKLKFYTCLYSYGDYLETFQLYDKAVATRQRAFELAKDCFSDGEKGLEYALTQLGICQTHVGMLDAAEENLQKGFELRDKLYEKDSSAYSHGLFSLGFLKHCKGELQEAKNLMDQHRERFYALPKIYRIDEGYYLTFYGALLRDLGEYEKAEESLEKSIALKENLYGGSHPDLIETWIELEKLYQKMNQSEKASQLKEKIKGADEEFKKRAGLQ